MKSTSVLIDLDHSWPSNFIFHSLAVDFIKTLIKL